MTMTTHKIGFLGDGAIAQKHKAAIAAVKGLAVGEICDALKPNQGMESLVKSSDAILICSPSGLHASQIMTLADLGAKKIICEKPVGVSLKQLDDLEAWGAPREDVDVIPVFQNRFLATVRGVKAITERHGNPFHVDVRVWWNRDEAYYKKRDWYNYPSQTGGAVTHQCLHFIDYPLWWGAESFVFDYNLRTHGGNYGTEVSVFGNSYFIYLSGETAEMIRDCRGVEFPLPWQSQESPRVAFWRAVHDWMIGEERDSALADLLAAIRASRSALHYEIMLNPEYRVMDHG